MAPEAYLLPGAPERLNFRKGLHSTRSAIKRQVRPQGASDRAADVSPSFLRAF